MSEEKPSVSVITPFYNAEDTIEKLLQCYSRQTIERPWEIIFVDNRSTDRSCEIIENFEGELPPHSIIPANDMPGAGYARNVGVGISNADALVFCDADDEIPEHHIAKMLEGVEEHGWVGCGVEDKKLNASHIVQALNFGIMELLDTGYLPFTGSGLMGVRKDYFETVGGFDTAFRFCEDTDFCYRLQLLGHSLHFQGETAIHVRLRSGLRAVCKQRFHWGRYERTLANRYAPYGHKPPGPRMKSFLPVLKNSLFFLLRCYDPEKRVRYGRLAFHQLGLMMPLQKEAHHPVMINTEDIDQGLLSRLNRSLAG